MAKINRINLLECTITKENDKFILKGKTKKGDEKEFNLTDVLETFIGEEELVFKLSKKSNRQSNLPPTYKYICPKCSKKVKTSEEGINLECLDCKTKLEIMEE